MGLMPVDGGGGARSELARCCHFCGEPAAGPCAWCRLLVCGSEACSQVFEERGLAPVVLCVDCARGRPILASRPIAAPAAGVTGLALLAVGCTFLGSGTLAGVSLVVGGFLVLLGISLLVSRWQWRSRLARARSSERRRPS
jgi:hypothetical protein